MNNNNDFIPIFKALSDSTRLQIIDLLSYGEMCATRILDTFDITQPTLSYHLKVLSECGIVNALKDGSWVLYSLDENKKNDIVNYINKLTELKDDGIK